jgi:hypothetical protein
MRDLQKNEEAFFTLQKKLRSAMIESQMDQRSDDPRAQGRLARLEKEDQEKNLRQIIEKKGSRDEFDAAAAAFMDAAKSGRDASTADGDRDRGNRNYQEDINTLGGLNTSFNSEYKIRAKSDLNEINSRMQGQAVRSPEEIARLAAQQALEAVKVEKVMLDAQIDLQIDGDLSKESEDRLAATIINKIKATTKNQNQTGNNYDPRTRSPASVVADDE